jgi:hypothetical protein
MRLLALVSLKEHMWVQGVSWKLMTSVSTELVKVTGWQ